MNAAVALLASSNGTTPSTAVNTPPDVMQRATAAWMQRVRTARENGASDDGCGTRCVHGDRRIAEAEGAAGWTSAVAPPMSLTTTFDTSDPLYVYSRETSPTRVRCEQVLGSLEDGHAILYASGLAAAHAAMLHFAPRRLAIGDGYHGVHDVAALLVKKGVIGAKLPLTEVASLGDGDLVWRLCGGSAWLRDPTVSKTSSGPAPASSRRSRPNIAERAEISTVAMCVAAFGDASRPGAARLRAAVLRPAARPAPRPRPRRRAARCRASAAAARGAQPRWRSGQPEPKLSTDARRSSAPRQARPALLAARAPRPGPG